MNHLDLNIQIFRRVFEAIDILLQSGEAKSLAAICEGAGLHDSKYREIRNNIRSGRIPRYHNVDASMIYYLVTEYKLSGDWLITGRGRMRHGGKSKMLEY